MGIIGDAKKFFNNTSSTVRNIASNPVVLKKAAKTLNEQINNGDILTTQPELQSGNFTNTGNTLTGTIDPFQPTFNIETPQPSGESQEDDDRPLNERITDWVGKFIMNDVGEVVEDATARTLSAPSRYNNYVKEGQRDAKAGEEYEDEKKIVALGYNPQYGSVYRLKSNNDELLAQIVSDAFGKLGNNPTWEEYNAAGEEAYNNSYKDLFELDALYGNTRNRFSQDELDKLQANNLSLGHYEPTKEEFFDYLNTLEENVKIYDNINKKYNISDGRITLDMENSEAAKAMQNFFDIAENGIQDRINDEIRTIDGREASEATLYYKGAVSDQIDRIMPFIESIFRYEKEALAKAPSERNDGDWYIIETAKIARRALDKYASNLNTWMNYILNEGVDNKGQIVDALDSFKDGSDLNDILTNGLEDVMGINTRLGSHVSPIDLFQELANNGIYKYKQANQDNLIKKGWNRVERIGSRSGDWFGEAGQAIGTVPRRVANLFTLHGRSPQSVAYLDMDFSIGKLIETDDSTTKRLLKKYELGFMEYAPEGVANIVPDMALIMYNAPGGASRTLTNIGRIGKFNKAGRFNRWFKAVDNIEKLRKKSVTVDKTLEGLDKIGEIGRERANIDSRKKRIWNIIDRTLTQLALGQGMDAKLSVYDTEPYSNASFYLSIFGSLLGDIMPELKDMYGVFRTGIKGGKGKLNAGVWDLVDYISESKENAQNIAEKLGKKYPRFSEQDLRTYVDIYAEVADAAKILYDNLTPEQKAAAGSWTKELLYNYVKQAYGENSNVGMAVRKIMQNKSTSPADIMKYVGRIPGDVQFGPYSSIIKLKNGTLAGISAKDGGRYDMRLDILDGGFNRRLEGGFSDADIGKISTIKGYEDIAQKKDKFFNKVGDNYFLSDDGLSRFGLTSKSLTLESLGVTIEQAENAREILINRMKDLPNNKATPETINILADGGGYDELVNKAKEILC